MAVLRARASSPQVLRKIVLEGHRFTPKEALAAGLVDHVAGENTAGVLAAAQALAGKVGLVAKTGAWGINKVRPPLYMNPHLRPGGRCCRRVPRHGCSWALYTIGPEFSVKDPISCSPGFVDGPS